MRFVAAVLAAFVAHHPSPLHHTARHWPASPRVYARQLVLGRWHQLSEWYALDAIVRPESGWNPCAVYGYRGPVCGYTGTNSCAIPQRNPCPAIWRGRLYATRWAQVRWLVFVYIPRRYGDPLGALAFRQIHGWY